MQTHKQADRLMDGTSSKTATENKGGIFFFSFTNITSTFEPSLASDSKLHFLFYFLQLYCPNGISPMGNSGCLPQGKPAVTELCYPTWGACWVF